MSIELHIERLVIDAAVLGGERADALRVAIEHELGRRLASPGTPCALRDIGARAALPPISMPAAPRRHETLGARIAGAVQGSLMPTAERGSHG